MKFLKNVDFRGFSLRHFGFDKRFGFTKEVTLDESYKDYFLDRQMNFFATSMLVTDVGYDILVTKILEIVTSISSGGLDLTVFLRFVGSTITKNVV